MQYLFLDKLGSWLSGSEKQKDKKSEKLHVAEGRKKRSVTKKSSRERSPPKLSAVPKDVPVAYNDSVMNELSEDNSSADECDKEELNFMAMPVEDIKAEPEKSIIRPVMAENLDLLQSPPQQVPRLNNAPSRPAAPPQSRSVSGPTPDFSSTGSFGKITPLPRSSSVVASVIKQITSTQRPLDRIVLAQAANGSFVVEHIAAALSIDVTRVKQALPAFLEVLENSLLLWATAIALSYLESRESNSRDEWDLIGGKAKKFLTKTLSATPQLVDQLLEEAKKFVATIN